jgi:hypothetical protein
MIGAEGSAIMRPKTLSKRWNGRLDKRETEGRDTYDVEGWMCETHDIDMAEPRTAFQEHAEYATIIVRHTVGE